MKINEVLQPSAKTQVKMLVESNVNDPDNNFSKETLTEIFENVVDAKFTAYDSIDAFMEALEKRSK